MIEVYLHPDAHHKCSIHSTYTLPSQVLHPLHCYPGGHSGYIYKELTDIESCYQWFFQQVKTLL